MKTNALNRVLIISGILTSAVLISSSAGSVTNSADCSTVTDAQLVTTILDEMKNDSLIGPQLSHIVVGSVNRFVKLQGWTDNRKGYDRVISIVSNTRCVVAINVNQFEEAPPPEDSVLRPRPSGGCATGMKQCGDVCIPEGDTCSTRTKAAD